MIFEQPLCGKHRLECVANFIMIKGMARKEAQRVWNPQFRNSEHILLLIVKSVILKMCNLNKHRSISLPLRNYRSATSWQLGQRNSAVDITSASQQQGSWFDARLKPRSSRAYKCDISLSCARVCCILFKKKHLDTMTNRQLFLCVRVLKLI